MMQRVGENYCKHVHQTSHSHKDMGGRVAIQNKAVSVLVECEVTSNTHDQREKARPCNPSARHCSPVRKRGRAHRVVQYEDERVRSECECERARLGDEARLGEGLNVGQVRAIGWTIRKAVKHNAENDECHRNNADHRKFSESRNIAKHTDRENDEGHQTENPKTSIREYKFRILAKNIIEDFLRCVAQGNRVDTQRGQFVEDNCNADRIESKRTECFLTQVFVCVCVSMDSCSHEHRQCDFGGPRHHAQHDHSQPEARLIECHWDDHYASANDCIRDVEHCAQESAFMGFFRHFARLDIKPD
eukprot:278142_1